MSSLTFRNRCRGWRVDLRLLRRIASDALAEVAALRSGPCDPVTSELGVCLVGAKRMAWVNRRYLNHDGPTDVITFDYGEAGETGAPANTLKGDLFICLEEAGRQARLFRTSWQAELVRYLVHGLLHLSGHDDQEVGARRRMRRVEERMVRRLASRFAFKRLGGAARVGP